MIRITFCASLILLQASLLAQQSSIINSKHNLSATGPGAIRAAAEQEVCIFCHTPHNASPIQPLWNRNEPMNAYTAYSSNSLQAKPGQPTGSSKLCLSCHDGTIAVGSVLSREQPIAMAGGLTTLPPGHGNLGTDLSDDHPVSFRYEPSLSAQDPKIRPPAALPTAVKLDRNQEMQCTSCHDAHNNTFGKFLVMDNTSSQLCSSCHQSGHTTIAAHNTCSSCHQMHTAPSGAKLLTGVSASEACLTCHSNQPSQVQGANIGADMAKISRHYRPPERPPMAPNGHGVSEQQSLTCSSCHEPHTMQSGEASAPQISPKLGKVSGVSATGGTIATAQFQFEVCYKCHAGLHTETMTLRRQITRLVPQTDVRLQFSPQAVSFHPVQAAGKSADVPSLRAGRYTSGSLIYCTDCHASETGKASGGTGPNGPHGSNFAPLLAARYETIDNTPESAAAYALCYKCHDRNSILGDESFSSHKKHIQELNTPCSVCHDAHGIASAQGTPVNNAHLMNFDTTVVSPDPVTGKLEYRSLGVRSGECTLSCHGTAHSPLAYPGGALIGPDEPPVLKALRARKTPLQRPPPTTPLKRGR